MSPIFKIGDTFALTIQFINPETNEGLELTSDDELKLNDSYILNSI